MTPAQMAVEVIRRGEMYRLSSLSNSHEARKAYCDTACTAAPALAQALLEALERLAAAEAERDALVAILLDGERAVCNDDGCLLYVSVPSDVISMLDAAHDARTKGEQG